MQNRKIMKKTVRFGCISFAFAVLLAGSTTATNLKEVSKQWALSLRNSVIQSQLPSISQRVGFRSAAVTKIRMDSMVLDGVESDTGMFLVDQKNVFQYNAYGQMTLSETYLRRDDNGNWDLDEKTTSTFDPYGYKMCDTLFRKSSNNNSMFASEVSEYRFDSNGLKRMESKKHKSGETYAWTGDYREEYFYDLRNRINLQLSYALVNASTWELVRKKENSYDAQDHLLSECSYYWSAPSENWIGLSKKEHYINGLQDTAVYEWAYYPLQSQWAQTNKALLRYDAGGHLTYRDKFIWNGDSSRWMLTSKDEFTYDPYGNKTLEASYSKDTSALGWKPESKEEWSFDEKGNLLSATIFEFPMENNEWWFSLTVTYQYDMNHRADEVVGAFRPGDLDMPYFYLITGGKAFYHIVGMESSTEGGTFTLYYSPMDVAGFTTNRTDATWYYNSTTRMLTFDPSTVPSSIQLYDLQGRQVLSRQNSTETTMSLKEVRKGLYLIRFDVDGTVQQGKLVVN